MATKSARRKLAIATLRSLNARRMEELVRLRAIRAEKRDVMAMVKEIDTDEEASRQIINSLAKRVQYEIRTNGDLLNVEVDLGDDFDDMEDDFNGEGFGSSDGD